MFSVKKPFSFYLQALIGITYSYSSLAANEPILPADASIPEKIVPIAESKQQPKKLADFPRTAFQYVYDEQQLAQNFSATEQLLNLAINSGQLAHIENLLKIYRTFPQQDPILVLFAEAQIAKLTGNHRLAIDRYRQIIAKRPDLTPVRIQLAISLFNTQQDRAAQDQFEKALVDPALPTDIRGLVQAYKDALDKRDSWSWSFSANYLHTDNVNNASSDRYLIGDNLFEKDPSMLPRSANGIAYGLGIERDFNLVNAHYLHVENNFFGRSYWDAHDYDEMYNRTYLGYRYKHQKGQISFLPFYERQWYADHRYKRGQGGRLELSHWLNPSWQISSALEFNRNRYYGRNATLDGNTKLFSTTLLWRRTPAQYFYAGVDFNRETTQTKNNNYDLRTARIGWGQEWGWGLSSRLSFSASDRRYKDNINFGSFNFDYRRQDEIYQINATLWKRDWHIWGITPKVNYRWKKQRSNYENLYSYSDKGLMLIFEKIF
ncbi:surface lipoprotein assembly modifier [Lonepinella sp. BR2271]|uniref:surface lipoprotein assembly modifier n=1 Tax=Lonepinella sp. BR2271 TaxID=3434550 RepID=UPI003F6DDB0A